MMLSVSVSDVRQTEDNTERTTESSGVTVRTYVSQVTARGLLLCYCVLRAKNGGADCASLS